MYQFPKWKYWLVILVLVVGVIFFIPNLFGQAPALQLSRNDRQAMDAPAQQSVLKLLQDAKVPVETSYLDKDRLVLRFATDKEQREARDAINTGGNGQYLIALADVPRTPAFIRNL